MPIRLLIISGSHPRHLFTVEPLQKLGFETLMIQIQRENFLPDLPSGLQNRDAVNFQRHFKERKSAEENYFQQPGSSEVRRHPVLKINQEDLHSKRVVSEIEKFSPDIAVVFGSGLIRDPLLGMLPTHTINLHLGISPEYKGSATLFWPFYMLEPQFAGFTIHKVVAKIDAGGIYSQGVPELNLSDGIHDVACKTVLRAQAELFRLVSHLAKDGEVNLALQKRTGKLWLSSDFSPAHLRIIYDTFDNDLVRAHLNGEIGFSTPRIHVGF
jgi:methionyl-tRNA formyltransferase